MKNKLVSEHMADLARELKTGGELTVVAGWGDMLVQVRITDKFDADFEVEVKDASSPFPYIVG